MAVAVQGVPVLSTRAGRVKFKQAVSTDQKWFYNRAGPCTEMRAFSGLRWKTHVLDGASEIAKRRNCSESVWALSGSAPHMIARQQEPAAVRNLNPAYVRFGW